MQTKNAITYLNYSFQSHSNRFILNGMHYCIINKLQAEILIGFLV